MDKVKFARELCRTKGIKYQIRGVDAALYIYDPRFGRMTQRCFSLYNLSEKQIEELVSQ